MGRFIPAQKPSQASIRSAIIDALRSGLPIRFVASSAMLSVSKVRAVGRCAIARRRAKLCGEDRAAIINAAAAGARPL